MNAMVGRMGFPVSRSVVRDALVLRREINQFQMTWPQEDLTGPVMPTFHWAALERQLADLAVSEAGRNMAPALVSATLKQSRWKPPELVLREILCLAAVLTDPDFKPSLLPGEEADMP